MSGKVQHRSGKVSVEEGVVLIDGPGAIIATLTPEVADATGRQLIDAAGAAKKQPATKADEADRS